VLDRSPFFPGHFVMDSTELSDSKLRPNACSVQIKLKKELAVKLDSVM